MKIPLTLIIPSTVTDVKRLPGLPPNFVHDLSFCKANSIRIPAGTVAMQEFSATDYGIFQWNFKIVETLHCYVEAEDGCIVLLQTIEAEDASLVINGQNMYLLPKMYSLTYIPAGTHRLVINGATAFFIFISPPLSFFEGLKTELPDVKQLIQYFLQQQKHPYQLPSYPMVKDGWMRLKKLDTTSLQKTLPDLHLRKYIIEVLHDYAKAAKEQPTSHLVYASAKQKAIFVKEYLDQNALDPSLPALVTLAKQFYIERRALSKAFTQLTGNTISQYILALRLTQAHKFVNETNLPIMEICFRCGFNDTSHFIRAFKHRYGLTPGRMRTGK